MTLIVHADACPALAALRCGAWPGHAFCAASSEAELRAALETLPPDVGIICGSPADPRLRPLLADLRAAAPDLALLWVTDRPDGADLPADAVTLPSLEPDRGFFHALALARRVTRSREETRRARDELAAMRELADELADLRTPAEISARLLAAAMTLLRRRGYQPASGAVLAAGEGAQLIVQAALPPYDACLGGALPPSLSADLAQLVEHQCVRATATQLLLPLCWYGRVRGALLLDGPALPAAPPDGLRLLARQGAAALEGAALFELAAIDATTSAYTRTFTLQRLYETLKSAYRSGLHLTIMMMDLDKFKLVNDTYGHLVGDRVLHAAGQLLRTTLRESDVLGRYGGDEFLLILPNTSIAGGIEVARRLLESVRAFSLEINGARLTLQVSIGIGGICSDDQPAIAGLRPDQAFFHRAMERLITQADGHMYRAKHAPNSPHYAAGLPMSWGSLIAGEGLLMV